MMSIDEVSGYGQRLDSRFGLIMPWYTHGALDALLAMSFADKAVLEWGGGASTFWWSRVARKVHTIEAHKEWADWIAATATARGFDNVSVERRWPEPIDEYLAMPSGLMPQVVCIDGSARTQCLEQALTLPRPLTVIFDNWQQDFVYIDERAEQMMEPYRACGRFYVQSDHTNHHGRPWQTAIWSLP